MSKKATKRDKEEDVLYSIVNGLNEFIEDIPRERWYLHTGNLALDYAISMKVDGTGGYPGGCVVELFGEPSTGKSLLLAKAVAEAQKLDVFPIIADAEGRWDDDFAEEQGVDPTKRKIFMPYTVEEFAVTGHKILKVCVEKNTKVLLILDSLAILSTEKESEDMNEGDMKADQGRKAQRIRQAIRILKSAIRSTGSIMMIANHVIANPGSYISQKITPGGGGVPFQSSVRIELLHTAPIKKEGKEHPLGVTLHAKVAKNSIAPPFGTCKIDLYWGFGVDKYSGLINIMVDQEIITREGAWYAYGENKFQSKNLEKFIESHPEILSDPKWSKPYWIRNKNDTEVKNI